MQFFFSIVKFTMDITKVSTDEGLVGWGEGWCLYSRTRNDIMRSRIQWLLTIPSHDEDERRRGHTVTLIAFGMIMSAILLFPLALAGTTNAGRIIIPTAIFGFLAAFLLARFVHVTIGASFLIAILVLGVFSSMLFANEPSLSLFYLPLSVLVAGLTLRPRQIWIALLANLLGLVVLLRSLPSVLWAIESHRNMLIGSLILLGIVTVISFLGATALTNAMHKLGEARIKLEATAAALARSNRNLEEQVTERTAELRQALATLEGQASELQVSLAERERAEQALAEERTLLARRVEERTADLSAANAELARAARLKDEFLASMSHELRTPLNAVLGLAEALQEEVYGPVTSPQRRSLQQIEASGRHLLDLINDILDLAKIEAGQVDLTFGAVAVASVCQSSLEVMSPLAAKKRIAVSSSIDSAVQTIRGDERRLKQILVNLLSNAVKFTPNGGQLGLEVIGDSVHQLIQLTVWDTGVGIAEDDLPRLFKPFVQLDSRLARLYEGAGLGLALVARMVELHGGSISVSSTLGQGSRFTVVLPWHAAASDQVAPFDAAAGERPVVLRQALIIEDSPTTATQLARYFHELDIVPHTHLTGQDALARAVALNPDVIILDIRLPDYSGWQLLADLKADPRTQAIPVMILSVEDDQRRGQAQGASAYLVKPITRQQLHAALNTLFPHEITTSMPPPDAAMLQKPARRPMLLLAEDNEANITTLSDYLRAKGFQVVVARTGYEAVAHAQEIRPDVIVMDIQMPELDGMQAIRKIRAEAALAHIPIIALTALAMPGDRERCLEAGANDYLSKPVSLKALTTTLAAQLPPDGLGFDAGHSKSAHT
jgi:signal transduction histidine kinase/DNA-binding response OmpR family regulator